MQKRGVRVQGPSTSALANIHPIVLPLCLSQKSSTVPTPASCHHAKDALQVFYPTLHPKSSDRPVLRAAGIMQLQADDHQTHCRHIPTPQILADATKVDDMPQDATLAHNPYANLDMPCSHAADSAAHKARTTPSRRHGQINPHAINNRE